MRNAASADNAGVRLALLALRFYKTYLSIMMGGTCRFEPTCSIYAYEAIERFGLGRGSWLALKRLLRCQPLSRTFGFDPVPESWPQGLKPNDWSSFMSELKLRPPKNKEARS